MPRPQNGLRVTIPGWGRGYSQGSPPGVISRRNRWQRCSRSSKAAGTHVNGVPLLKCLRTHCIRYFKSFSGQNGLDCMILHTQSQFFSRMISLTPAKAYPVLGARHQFPLGTAAFPLFLLYETTIVENGPQPSSLGLSPNSTWLVTSHLDTTRHVERVEPTHFGCVELVEQHGSTRSSRRARQVERVASCRHVT